MVSVGDRVSLVSSKGPDREGVVTGVTGSLVRIRWPSDEETTVVPAPGTLSVLPARRRRTTVPAPAKEAAPATKAMTTTKKTAGAKKSAPAKRSATSAKTAKKTGPARQKTTASKRSSGRGSSPKR
ncbi:MAG: hypothetical protein H0U89_08655 [Acidimicrobiia bacterium]|nr:hypothetical protein [Acidimicrobiia bacterium]